jgi:signal peptidase II
MPPGYDRLKKGVIAASIALPALLLDVVTKQWIVQNLSFHDQIDILPFLKIVHVENRGAAFGMFSGLGNPAFVILAVIVIIIITLYILKLRPGWELGALSLILGGAAGNLVDRIRYGKVIDFIDFYVNAWHWPAFNVADSALTIGIIIFVLASLFRGHKEEG